MCGAGKSEVIRYLQKKEKWPKIYFGEATFDRLKKDGLAVNYRNERLIREKIRAEMGMGAYALLALPKIKEALRESAVVLVESLYSWDEYKILKKEFGADFLVIAVYSSPSTRLKRMLKRVSERPVKDEAEFVERDYREIEGTDKGGPIARADFTIVNEAGLDEFHGQIENIINNLE